MASEADPDKTPPAKAPRHIYGPRPLSALLPNITRAGYRKRSPAQAQLLADWTDIVGPALAAVTTPRRLGAGTLTIGCAGPVALELQHLSAALLERINRHLGPRSGKDQVERLRFVHEDTAPSVAPNRDASARVAPEVVESRLDGLEEGPLKEALRALGLAALRSR